MNLFGNRTEALELGLVSLPLAGSIGGSILIDLADIVGAQSELNPEGGGPIVSLMLRSQALPITVVATEAEVSDLIVLAQGQMLDRTAAMLALIARALRDIDPPATKIVQ
jgi:hypothetical protein